MCPQLQVLAYTCRLCSIEASCLQGVRLWSLKGWMGKLAYLLDVTHVSLVTKKSLSVYLYSWPTVYTLSHTPSALSTQTSASSFSNAYNYQIICTETFTLSSLLFAIKILVKYKLHSNVFFPTSRSSPLPSLRRYCCT